MVIFTTLTALSLGPVIFLLQKSVLPLFIPVILYICVYLGALKLEKLKKSADIKTYAEIVPFSEGKPVDELRNKRDKASYFYEKVGIVFIFSLVFLIICLLSIFLSYFFMK